MDIASIRFPHKPELPAEDYMVQLLKAIDPDAEIDGLGKTFEQPDCEDKLGYAFTEVWREGTARTRSGVRRILVFESRYENGSWAMEVKVD